MRNTAVDIRKPPSAEAWESVPCRQTPDLFFPEGKGKAVEEQAEAAIRVCGTCELIDACRAGALERREPLGIWGGAEFADGVVVVHRARTVA